MPKVSLVNKVMLVPKGATGSQGSKGVTGPQGGQGLQGAVGNTGETNFAYYTNAPLTYDGC